MGAKGAIGASRARGAKRAGAGKVALVRALSKLGYASRSQAYELIRAGRVEVNGRPATDPALHVVPGLTRIEISGAEVTREPWVCIALNKPRKVVTTRSDPEGRPTVYDLIAGRPCARRARRPARSRVDGPAPDDERHDARRLAH